jgi:DNA-directed RNA polymerase subunit RPC12/RpoP
MARKNKGVGFPRIPGVAVVIISHVLADVITDANCPQCGGHVVLYVCLNCKKVVRPRRGRATS